MLSFRGLVFVLFSVVSIFAGGSPSMSLAQGPLQRVASGIRQAVREVATPNRTMQKTVVQQTCTGPECQSVEQSSIVYQSIPFATSIDAGIPTSSTTTTQATSSTQAIVLTKQQLSFRSALIREAERAQRDGKIGRLELLRIRFASGKPQVLAQLEAIAGDQFRFESGTTAQAIDWDGLASFFERLLPLLIELLPELIKLFG